MTEFSAALRNARKQRKMSQGALAAAFRVSRQSLNYWENGRADAALTLAAISLDPDVEPEYRELAAALLQIAQPNSLRAQARKAYAE